MSRKRLKMKFRMDIGLQIRVTIQTPIRKTVANAT